MHPDVTADLDSLDATLTTVEKVLDLEELRRRIDELEMQASDPDLWNDQDHAQKVTSELSHAQSEFRKVSELRQRLEDLPVLYELAEAEEGDGGGGEGEGGKRDAGGQNLLQLLHAATSA